MSVNSPLSSKQQETKMQDDGVPSLHANPDSPSEGTLLEHHALIKEEEGKLEDKPISSDPIGPKDLKNANSVVILPRQRDTDVKDEVQIQIEETVPNSAARLNIDVLKGNEEDNVKITEKFTCSICYSKYEMDDTIRLWCTHRFCKGCLKLYIETEMTKFNCMLIRCPESKCYIYIQEETIKDCLEEEVYKRYKKFKELQFRRRNYQARYCPYPGCARELKVNPIKEYTQCDCGGLICNGCFEPKHDEKTCAEIQKDIDELYSKYSNLKMCIICKTAVQRGEGCNKVKCPVCDYVWCWECGRQYVPGHFSRCGKQWHPVPPQKFKREKVNVLKQIGNALCLLFEMCHYFLTVMIGMIFGWPFLSVCFLSDEDPKLPCWKLLLAFFGAVLVWPLAAVVVPIVLVFTEYCPCIGRRRWAKGNVKLFGVRGKRSKTGLNIFNRFLRRRSGTRNDDAFSQTTTEARGIGEEGNFGLEDNIPEGRMTEVRINIEEQDLKR